MYTIPHEMYNKFEYAPTFVSVLEDTVEISGDSTSMSPVQLLLSLKIQRSRNILKVSNFSRQLCN